MRTRKFRTHAQRKRRVRVLDILALLGFVAMGIAMGFAGR